jgi:hypothetical protein
MIDCKLAAEYYRIGLVAGIVSIAEVVAWADRLISLEDTVDSALFDVSLAGSKSIDEMDSVLRGVRGAANPEAVGEALLGRLADELRAGKRDVGTVICLAHHLIRTGVLSDKQSGEVSVLEEYYDRAVTRIEGDLRVMEAQIADWLRPFEGSDTIARRAA